jgi:large subunit ribosomal protein L22
MRQIRRGKIVSETRGKRRGSAKTAKRVYAEGRYGATLRGIRVAPNKARLVADLIRGQELVRARQILRFTRKRAAYYFDRVLLSALGNADAKSGGRAKAEGLIVAEAFCDEGSRYKRFKCGPHGRARPILRRTCHMTVVLESVGS